MPDGYFDTFYFMFRRLQLFTLVSILNATWIFGAPSWLPSEIRNGALDQAGTLHSQIPLGILRGGSPEFSFPITLNHSLSKYPYKEFPVFSKWQIPQLVSYVVPRGNNIFWVAPGGEETLFSTRDKRNLIYSKKPSKFLGAWAAIRGGKGSTRTQIVSSDGWTYTYEGGYLKMLEAPSGRKLLFDTNGIQITRIYQQEGTNDKVLLSADYDTLNRPKQVRMAGRTFDLNFQDESELLQSMIPMGIHERKVEFSYNDGLISSIAFPGGRIETFEWLRDPASFRAPDQMNLGDFLPQAMLVADTHYRYRLGKDIEGIHLTKTNKLDESDSVIFNPLTNRMTTIDRGGIRTTVQWSNSNLPEVMGKLSEVVGADGKALVKIEYDESGRPIKVMRKGDSPVYFAYDAEDRVVAFNREDYPPFKYEYSGPSKTPSKATDPLGQTQAFYYGEDGQIARTVLPDGNVTTYTYDSLGRLIRRNISEGLWQAFSYDLFGRLEERSMSTGHVVKFAYGENDQVSSVIDSTGVQWTYDYYPTGEIRKISRNGETWMSYSLEVKDNAKEVAIRDQDGNVRHKSYDLEGRLLKEISPMEDTIEYRYDPIGQLEGWTDPDGGQVSFRYNKRGNMVEQQNDLNQVLKHTYDDLGRFKERQTDEQLAKIDYDNADRIVKIDYQNGQSIEYAYDKYGRRVACNSGGVLEQYIFDALDRQTGRRMRFSDGGVEEILLKYRPNGTREEVTVNRYDNNGKLQESIVTHYAYDRLSRLNSVSLNGVKQISYIYDPKKLMLKEKLFSSGAKTVFRYDASDRLQEVEDFDPSGASLGQMQYLWDSTGNLVSRTFAGASSL